MWPSLGENRWTGSRPCQIDGCGVRSWRFCVVCSRWACSSHRNGCGWRWRCVQCPEEAFTELCREQHQREKQERARERELAAFRCGWCFLPWFEFPRGVFRPDCACYRVVSAREVFAGL